MFGAVNALFSALALAGVVTAIWRQREELVGQIEADAHSERQRQSILLFERWHSADFYSVRTFAVKFCEAKKGVIRLDEMVTRASSEKANAEELCKILHFFELWGRLVEARLADEKLLKEFLGNHARNWNNRLISRLEPKDGEVGWVFKRMTNGL